jgi:hypothetical protein
MGVVIAEVVFDGQAPELSRIAEKVTELSTLPLSVTESGADVKAGLYDLHASLAFACAPRAQLELYSYRPGAVKEFYQQTFGDADLPLARFVQGLNEPPGTQAVYLQGYVGQEPTLLFVTELALETLGGRPRESIPEEMRREYGAPVSAAQLKDCRRKSARQGWFGLLIVVVLLPLLIPLWLFGVLWGLISMPWRIWKGYQLYRSYKDGRGGAA